MWTSVHVTLVGDVEDRNDCFSPRLGTENWIGVYARLSRVLQVAGCTAPCTNRFSPPDWGRRIG